MGGLTAPPILLRELDFADARDSRGLGDRAKCVEAIFPGISVDADGDTIYRAGYARWSALDVLRVQVEAADCLRRLRWTALNGAPPLSRHAQMGHDARAMHAKHSPDTELLKMVLDALHRW
ncbi:hypothetical protein ABZ543_13140 [Streptomyces roseifaciens]